MFAMSMMEQRIESLHAQGDAVVEAVITGSVLDGNKATAQSALKGTCNDPVK